MILLSKRNLSLLLLNAFLIGINVLNFILNPSVFPVIAIAVSAIAINLVFKSIKKGR